MKALKYLFSILTCTFIFINPTQLRAEDEVFATSSDGSKEYNTIEDAWSAAQNGIDIVLYEDWHLDSKLELGSGKTANVEMNGYTISRNLDSQETDGEVICLKSGSTLNLTGNNYSSTEITYMSLNQDGTTSESTVTTGGLITGGNNVSGAGGIDMKSSSTLNLENVTIAGNKAEQKVVENGHGGGIGMDGDSCNLIMTHSSICFNYAQYRAGGLNVNGDDCVIKLVDSTISNNTANGSSDNYGGGGIYIDGDHDSVYMSNSSINQNYTNSFGGGICTNDTNAEIIMTSNSYINENNAKKNGGGIYFKYSNFSITSDGYGNISKNSTDKNGGGIYLCKADTKDSSGSIQSITFDSNEAKKSGGAICSEQNNFKLSNCEIKNNASKNGGGIHITAKDNEILDTTIKENLASCAGGGVVASKCDITLNGNMVIEDNKSKDGTIDNLYLDGGIILGSLIEDAKVGIRMDDTGIFAKEQSGYIEGTFLLDDSDSYHISYDEQEQTLAKEKTDTTSVTSSVFGNGSFLMVVILVVAILFVGCITLIMNMNKEQK